MWGAAAAAMLLLVGCGSGAVAPPEEREAAGATPSSTSTPRQSDSPTTDVDEDSSSPAPSDPEPTAVPTVTKSPSAPVDSTLKPSKKPSTMQTTHPPAPKPSKKPSTTQTTQPPAPKPSKKPSTTQTTQPPAPKPTKKPAVRYDWGLPTSDTSVTGNEGPAYNDLSRSCDEGDAFVQSAWENFNSPRNVLLFAAGVGLCRGDRQAGARYFDAARTLYGLDGLQPEGKAECDVYKSVRSVLEQQPREAFPCPGGLAPQYRIGPGGKDNPLTFNVDESTTTAPIPADSAP